MARPINEEIQDLLQGGQVTERLGNKWGKAVRNVDQDPLDVNDEFSIPETYKILETALSPGGDPQAFILIPVRNTVTGVERNMRFFPNQLAKVVYPIVNGKRDGKVKTQGTAAQLYQTFAVNGNDGMDLAMAALSQECKNGKKIRVTAKQTYRTTAYQSSQEVDTNVFTYDFV